MGLPRRGWRKKNELVVKEQFRKTFCLQKAHPKVSERGEKGLQRMWVRTISTLDKRL